MFLPLKRPIGLALIAMLLLVVSPAVLAADDAAPENPFETTITSWIDGFFDLLKDVTTESWPLPAPDDAGPPEELPPNDNRPDDAGPSDNGHNPPEEIGPGAEPGSP